MSAVTYFQNRDLLLGLFVISKKSCCNILLSRSPPPKSNQQALLISLIFSNVLLCPNKYGNQFSFKYSMNSRVRVTKVFLREVVFSFQIKDILLYLNWIVVMLWFSFQSMVLIQPLNKKINQELNCS